MALFKDGYIYWQKGDTGKASINFLLKEFECPCDICLQQKISVELVGFLQGLRRDVGLPIKVNSAYRCEAKQQELRDQGYQTAVNTSQHELGNAVDITCQDMLKLKQEAEKYFWALGVGKSFLHLDTRHDKKRYWTY